MEIVTEPDMRTAEQARRYAEELQLAPADDRRLRRGHGARPAPGRGERLAPAARHRGVRDAGRGQEHELVPLGGAGGRVRDRAPGGDPRRGRDAAHGDPRLVRRPRRDLPHAEQGDVRRLPLLPGAGPAAAARRRRLAARDPGRARRSCPPTRRARYRTDARAVGVRRRRPRRATPTRPACSRRRSPRDRASRRRPSRTG